MDTLLYTHSIPIISSLQDQLSEHASFMQLVSTLFDPKYAFLVYSPIAYLLDQRVGKKLILTTVIAEWLNQILKWLLHGERPYWYVHSSGHFDPQLTPIKQFPITCELGPGHPSGHAMVTAAVWYIILDSALAAYNRHVQSHASQQSVLVASSSTEQVASAAAGRQQAGIKLSTWALYLIILLTVSVSRVFLGCHFPHQCLAGSALGLALAKWISSLETKPIHFVATSGFVLTTAFATFFFLQLFGFDPSWTIKLATRFCAKREYIHLDTAPFFSIMRYCGFALGTGLGLILPVKSFARNVLSAQASEVDAVDKQAALDRAKSGMLFGSNFSWFSARLLTAMLMARLVDNLGLFVSHSNLWLFYSCALLAYTLFSYALINLDHRQTSGSRGTCSSSSS